MTRSPSLRMLALALPLVLAGCVTTGSTPVVVTPGAPIVVTPATPGARDYINQIVAGTIDKCRFEPLAATVTAIAGTFSPTVSTIGTVISEICAVANQLKTARAGRGRTVAITVRGVPLRGRFV